MSADFPHRTRGPAARRRAATTTPGSIRHATLRRRKRHSILIGLLAVGLFVTSGAAWAFRDLNTNIETHHIDELLGTERPEAPEPDPEDPAAGQPLNIVLIGSDDRSGDNAAISDPEAPGIRSDTVIVAHISADRDRVELISIPRDSWVVIPECELPDGGTSYPQETKFNAAFATGGIEGDIDYAAACTIRTIESLTDVRMDGFIAVDFAGFVDVVDALGGIPFCVPEAVDDPNANLTLETGEQVLDGHDALGYARVRKTLGDGSDTQRIGRQQDLLAATARHALSQNLLTDGPALYAFLDAATSAVTASQEFGNIPALVGLAHALRGIDPADITFTTVPFVDRGDGANVLWQTEQAAALWDAVGNDQPITVEGDEDEAPPAADETGDDETGTEAEGGEGDDAGDASADQEQTGPTVQGSTAEEDPCG